MRCLKISNLFNTLDLKSEILDNLKSLGYLEMTPVQEKSLPVTIKGQDVRVQAKTGSGKTVAFALSLINSLDIKTFWPQGLVLCPTRELAEQVTTEFRKLSRQLPNTKILAICGGTSEYHQIRSLHHGVHIIVGTPGRVKKLIKSKDIDTKHLKTLILDEADRMLDMGFYDEISEIISYIPKKRQTMLFSATFPSEIKELSKTIQKDAVVIKVDSEHQENIIEQYAYLADSQNGKKNLLIDILNKYQPISAIIFCNTKDTCREVNKYLKNKNLAALEIHGDLEQRDRNLTLTKFSNKSAQLLVATDVAARGLDIDNLAAVINYDISLDEDSHTHRIGRTGRAGKTGVAIHLYTPKEKYRLEDINSQNTINFLELGEIDQDNKYKDQATMDTIFISAGRKDKIRPGDILGTLTSHPNIEGHHIGVIKMFDVFCYVAVSKDVTSIALSWLRKEPIKKKSFKSSLV